MSGKHIKNIAFERQAFQTTELEAFSDGFVENLLRFAQSKFEVFSSKLVKEAAKHATEHPSVSRKLVDGYPVIDYLICTSILLASLFDSEAVVASGLQLYESFCNYGEEFLIIGKNGRRPKVEELVRDVASLAREEEERDRRALERSLGSLLRDVSKRSKPSGISREKEQRNSEQIQDSILNTVQDVRAVLIKIALRTVQMIVLDKFNPERKQSLVKETLDVYVPLLERLGFSLWKSELENLCASASDHELMKLYDSVSEYDADGIAFADKLKEAFYKENLYICPVEFHKRRLHNIQNKMSRKHITFSEKRVIICLRVIMFTVDECYRAKAVVEEVWKAEPEFGKDYIKYPKANRCKSLHVIVKNAKDQYMKVYISTFEVEPFHSDLHWAYKDRDVHVPLENVELLVEFASRIQKKTKFEFIYTGRSDVEDFLRDAGLHYEVFKSDRVERAAKLANLTQREKKLLDGYPVIEHLTSTAIHLAGSFNSDIIVASGLLIHGPLAGTKLEYKELKREFGKEVAKVVRDVSKLSKLSKISRKEPLENAKLLPNFILAMGVDARAVAIKIAECIVQMTVLDKLNLQNKGFVNEILCVYVPLSERLGLSSWKIQLENLCKYADDAVKEAYESVSDKDKDGNAFKDTLEKELKKNNFPNACVEFRKKSLLSILNKMSNKKEQNLMSKEENNILEIKDILGLRIIIEEKANESKEDVRKRCNAAKDVVTNLWTLERVKDFFETPNDGYESLHVIVKNPNNHYMEVQIRSSEMHEKIDGGHWRYKEGNQVQEHVKMLVEMARFSINNQTIKVPVYVLVEEENKVTKIEERPIGTRLEALCLERGLKGPLWGRVFVNQEQAFETYTLKMGDIIEIQCE